MTRIWVALLLSTLLQAGTGGPLDRLSPANAEKKRAAVDTGSKAQQAENEARRAGVGNQASSSIASPQVSYLAGTNSIPASTVNAGAGSFFSQTNNKLYEVEWDDGSLNTIDLSYKTSSSWDCNVNIPSGYSFDPLACVANQGINGGVFFDNTVGTVRPLGNNYLSFLGVMTPADFAALDSSNLQQLSYPYHTTGIPLASLPLNTVFIVFNNYPQTGVPYYYIKVQITLVLFTGNVPTTLGFHTSQMIVNPLKTRIGTGYSYPKDIVLTSDGTTAYVSEDGTGTILRVPLGATANRAQATVIASGLNQPQQLAFDRTNNRIFTVEYAAAGAGRLLQIDLGSGVVTPLMSNFTFAVGLLANCDFSMLYISDQGTGSVTQVALSGLVRTTIQSGFLGPFFLAWNQESSCTGLLVVERNSAPPRVTLVNILPPPQGPVSSTFLTLNLDYNPTSVRRVSPTLVTITAHATIQAIAVSSFQFGDPLLLGIGLVPFDKIDSNGYADTTADPLYFFQVKNSPFGGTLSIMLNHDAARAAGALYYTISVDGVKYSSPFGDYLWSSAQGKFVYATQKQLTVPVGGAPVSAFYVRQAYELWYNHFLGYLLDTTVLPQGPRTLSVQFYSSCTGFLSDQTTNAGATPANTQNDCGACQAWCYSSPVCYYYIFGNFQKTSWNTNICPSPAPAFSQALVVQIDNTPPQAVINTVFYYASGYPGPQTVEEACTVVQGPDNGFTFNITAIDREQNLLSWSLWVVWGENKSGGIASDTYAPSHSSSDQWLGFVGLAPSSGVWHASVAGDNSSKQCAHTFILGVWDRTINGYGYIHSASYSKSLTLLLS